MTFKGWFRISTCALVLIALFATLTGGCAETAQTRRSSVTKSGFLKNYDQLRKGKGQEALWVYVNPDVNFTQYDNIIVDPIALWLKKDAGQEQASSEDMQRMVLYLDKTIRKQLENEYAIVGQPGPRTARLRVAITEAEGSKPTLDTLTTIPGLRLISRTQRLLTGSASFVGRTSVEMEIVDSVSGERLAAAIDERAGTKALRDKMETWADVEAAYDYWSERLRVRLREWRVDSSLAGGVSGPSVVNSLGMALVRVEPGTFVMGTERDDQELTRRDEYPQRNITLTRPFYLGQMEVTQLQWMRIMGVNPSKRSIGPSMPVTEVSWEDCQEFCKRLNEEEHKAKRLPADMAYTLPTEAEWEYACRAGSDTDYCFGDDPSKLGDYAWYAANSDGVVHQGGQKKPNAFGLYDMHGNVWEACRDWKASYDGFVLTDPTGPAEGEYKVGRGGSFGNQPGECRSAKRAGATPGFKTFNAGLRLALEQYLGDN